MQCSAEHWHVQLVVVVNWILRRHSKLICKGIHDGTVA